jgi:TPR repeat protein
MRGEAGGIRVSGKRFGVALCSTFVVMLGGGMVPAALEAKPAAARNAEDLMIVDCLLPGQVRKLGRQATYMSARRPVRTTQADCEIRGGEYVSFDRANYQTALKVWMGQAEAGDGEAQNYVGEIYQKGLGTAPNPAEAARWYEKAVAQGNRRAMRNLGYLLEQGEGVQRDPERALNLYRQAAGLTDDALVFASTMQLEIQTRETRIGELQQEVAAGEAERVALRSRISQLEGQLEARRRALQGSEVELDRVRRQLDEARQQAGGDFREVDRLRGNLVEREAELVQQQQDIDRQRAEAKRLADESQGRLAALRERERELMGQSEQSAESTRRALEEIRAQAASLSQSLLAAQERVETMQAQVAQNRSVLEEERLRYQAEIERLQAQAAGREQQDWELMKLLESQLAARESEVRQQRQQIAALETQVSSTRTAGGGMVLAAAGPRVEIIDPPLTLTRGRPAAMLRGAPGSRELVGRVAARDGVSQVSVNGQPATVASNGLFKATVQVQAGGTPIEITAVDRSGRVGTVDFTIVPQSEQAPGARRVQADPVDQLPGGVRLGRYFALVIGNNNYRNPGFVQLQSAQNDATAVAQLLRSRYRYETTLLLNATRLEMLSALNDLRESLGESDNLLVYYAGHGELSPDGGQGYWIPTDAVAGNASTWISNAAVSDVLNTMKAKHVLVVADSCYSGAMTRAAMPVFDGSVPAERWKDWVSTMSQGRSRTALTSGGLQPVPDTGEGRHSYFARAFLNVLSDNNRLLDGQRLFREVATVLAVAAVDAPITQSPEYAPIQFAGHESGEFFFLPVGSGRGVGP